MLAFENVDAVVGFLGVKLKRIMGKLLEKLNSALTSEEVKLEEYTEGVITPNCNDPSSDLYLLTDFEECEGVLLQANILMLMDPNPVSGKVFFYKNCVKTLNKKSLHNG